MCNSNQSRQVKETSRFGYEFVNPFNAYDTSLRHVTEITTWSTNYVYLRIP